MKKLLVTALFALFIAAPAFSDSVYFLAGYVSPKGNSDIFDQNVTETTFEVNDLNDIGGTIGYDHFLGEFVNVGVSATFYQSDTNVEDVDFVFTDGSAVRRNIALQIVPLEFNVRFLPLGREKAIIPYFGGGAGAYFWEYEERGDFVINRNTSADVITGRAFSDGTDAGFHVEGGIQIPISRSATITAEARYWKAEGNLDERGFDPAFEPIDLSATMFSAGFSLWF